MCRTIIIGDIHGCYYTMISLLNKIKYDENKDMIVFIGDYIDRGKNSFEVVNYLIHLQYRVGKDRCICLMGNHEYMALYDHNSWRNNGYNKTNKSYHKHGKIPTFHNWWFEKLPYFYEIDNYFVCHAGTCNTENVSIIKKEEFVWDRTNLKNTIPTSKIVVFGHTPTKNKLAYITLNGNIDIDSDCVHGGNLCACIINDGRYTFEYEPKNNKD